MPVDPKDEIYQSEQTCDRLRVKDMRDLPDTHFAFGRCFRVSVPKSGGDVTGKISGDCDGNVTGAYDGQNNGNIKGQANVTCHLMFMQIPGKASFNGTVNKDNKTAQLQVTFSADSFQKTAPVTFSFN